MIPPESESWWSRQKPANRVAVVGTRRALGVRDCRIVSNTVRELVDNTEVQCLVFDGMEGVGTCAMVSARYARKAALEPRIVVVIPDRVDQFPGTSRKVFRACADKIVSCGLRQNRLNTAHVMSQRHRWIMDHCGSLVVIGTPEAGLLVGMVEYARESGRAVTIVPLVGD